MWKQLLEWLWTRQVKRVLATALALAAVGVTETSVAAAKAKVKRAIQDQHKVPGELRRVACWWVDDITAGDVHGLMRRLDALAG